jgi:hypothetical protein
MLHNFLTRGMYYKHITIVNYDSSIVSKFGASLTDDARVVIYYHHMFIVQATGEDLVFGANVSYFKDSSLRLKLLNPTILSCNQMF